MLKFTRPPTFIKPPAHRLRRSVSLRESNEQSIASARASVMVYDDTSKKWIPSGSSSGLSKVHIFQNISNNTFRVVARKLQDHEVVINCIILKGLKYNQATHTFHQWRDNKQVYGLNFSSREDADGFARAMTHALDVLNSNSLPRPPPQPMATQLQSHYQQANGQFDEDMGYRTMTREDVAMIQERRMSTQSQISSNGSASSPGVPVPPTPPGHHRTSSAPPAPQPPPMSLAPPPPPVPPAAPAAPPCPPAPGPPIMGIALPVAMVPPPMTSAPPPAAFGGPPCGPATAGAPPPPPPPPVPNMSRSSSNDGNDSSSLAAQLQSAKLRRSNKQSAENSGSSTSSSGSNYGTLGRGGTGMASMMDEMAKTLARRRAAAERKEVDPGPQEPDYGTAERKNSTWGGSGSKLGNGCESSPKPSRRALASSEESLPKVNGDASLPELEALKQEILREMRREINRMKSEIIDALKTELNRR
ncbi:Hypothetical protein NTJ_01388 [Nesidiocoris tenuis]|uniref:WH1 domain-containing protein n=1 Tax=Nesidiocoris tenuis TaxID=355587 RepID=A0ABN7AE89_9HEMI|nr:Hypothetical protein NTJ_01388 [Nesidiocoris tenuis]